MITLFPAIDILDGKSVRLLRGAREDVTVYGTPVEMAARWKQGGAEWLHVVDLNGAFDGAMVNTEYIRGIVETTKLNVQVGGGIRTTRAIETYLDAGVVRVILGTAIFADPKLLTDALHRFGSDRIVCGIDARDGKVAIKGWVQKTEMSPIELGLQLKEQGVKTVVYTDISRDGALTGVNAASCAELSDCTKLQVVASGGLKDLDDIRACRDKNLYGAILGKAIYEEKFTLPEAYRVAKEAIC